MTRGISNAIEKSFEFWKDVAIALERYSSGDWGDLCEEDKQANDYALKCDGRLLGKYNTCKGSIYIITEWDRSVTTILFPDEY